MTTEFLGKGWSFPVTLVPTAPQTVAAEIAAYEESVAQAVWIVLATAKGERVMRPDFGCGIHDHVFAVDSTTTAGLVEDDVRQALLLWEPRIDVLEVHVRAKPDEAATLLISIDYRVRETNNVFNLVYPFYLEPRAAPS